MRKIACILFSSLMILQFVSCSHDPLDIDVSDVDLEMKLVRLDEAVFESSWNSPEQTNQELLNEYGDYYKFYSQFVLNNQAEVESAEMSRYMAGFASDKTMKGFYSDIESKYGDDKFDDYLNEFENAFKHYKYYFPNEKTPNIFTFQSGFNYKIVPNDTLLGIGLEWYLGKENEYVKRLSPEVFPQYEKNKMNPEFW